jgi:hypothetical protein
MPDDNVAALEQGKCKSLKNSVRLADSSGFGDGSGVALSGDQNRCTIIENRGRSGRCGGRSIE